MREADQGSGQLPARGEFVVRHVYVVTTDPELGSISNDDVHLGNDLPVAVGANLNASRAQVIGARNRIACPGFSAMHWHLWGGLEYGL